MLTIACFKWEPQPDQAVTIPSQTLSGSLRSPYTAWDVNNMHRMLSANLTIPWRMVCVTDDAAGINAAIDIVPMWDTFRELGGCCSRLRVFSEEMRDLIGPRFACIDLDTVIVGNCDHVFCRTEPFVYYRWEGKPGEVLFNCGLFIMDAGCRSFVWDEFAADPHGAIAKCKDLEGTDQAWCNYRIDLASEAHVGRADGIYDFRVDFLLAKRRDLPADACMVTWPGPRDPKETKWHARHPWIAQHYGIAA